MNEDLPENSRELNQKYVEISDCPDIPLRSLFLFSEIMKSGSQVEIADRYGNLSPAKVSRDMKSLKQELHLSHIPDKDFWDSPEAHTLQAVLSPLFDACKKYMADDYPRKISIGAGGSILGWWIGQNTENIRDACSAKGNYIKGDVSDVRISCRPMTNRDILEGVSNGILDFGVVRKSLLDYSRIANPQTGSVASRFLGVVTYGIAVPKRLMKVWAEAKRPTDWSVDGQSGSLLYEKSILNSGYFASVGPEGEFKERLNHALAEEEIDLKIEFSYKSFPQILPHLHAGTHFGLCPMLNQWGAHIPDVEMFPLNLLKDYKREIVLIWNKNLKRQWINVEKITNDLIWCSELRKNLGLDELNFEPDSDS
jgi:hypothetical protein